MKAKSSLGMKPLCYNGVTIVTVNTNFNWTPYSQQEFDPKFKSLAVFALSILFFDTLILPYLSKLLNKISHSTISFKMIK